MKFCESEPGNIKLIKKPLNVSPKQNIVMVNYWLAKQEPSGPRGYNFEQLKKDKTTIWDGVHNNLALKHMREMKSGDLILFYHTGDERQAVGIMQVTSKPYSNPKEDVERFIVVDVKYKKTLKRPVTLAEIKNNKKFIDTSKEEIKDEVDKKNLTTEHLINKNYEIIKEGIGMYEQFKKQSKTSLSKSLSPKNRNNRVILVYRPYSKTQK
jgi:predicted RNA-binding protein with PUA-like domain